MVNLAGMPEDEKVDENKYYHPVAKVATLDYNGILAVVLAVLAIYSVFIVHEFMLFGLVLVVFVFFYRTTPDDGLKKKPDELMI